MRHRGTHGERKFICQYCPNKYFSKPSLDDHIRNKHGDNINIFCDHCSKVFTSRQGYASHMKSVKGDYSHKCEICFKSFLRKDRYEGHMHTHYKNNPHKCSLCDMTFAHKGSLKRHKNFCSGKDDKDHVRTLYCDLCWMSFKSLDALRNHQQGKHQNNIFICQTCGKRYNWRASYYRHIKSHAS